MLKEQLNEKLNESELSQRLEQAEELEPKAKKLKLAESNESTAFDDLISDLKWDPKWDQLETSGALRPFLNEYRQYISEQAAICIQQSFRKYLLLIKKTSIRSDLEASGNPDRCSEEYSQNWSDTGVKECERRLANECNPDEKCGANCIHGSFCVRACSEELDPNWESNCNTDCTSSCLHGHCPASIGCCSTNSLNEPADCSKDSPSDCCSTSTCSPRCGRLTEGSFKSKKNELLNCSMDIDMCPTKDEHSFQLDESDELKGKRCSAASASLSCMEKLSAKR